MISAVYLRDSSLGKDKVDKWEFCKLKITTIFVFVIMTQRNFSTLRVSANALYECYSAIVDSFTFIH